jgi:hypothetical protein
MNLKLWLIPFLLLASTLASQTKPRLRLGATVPQIALAYKGKNCLTDVGHYDPCASLKVGRAMFTVAWDANSKAITYVFTRDLVTDSELAAGGSCRVQDEFGKPDATTPYNEWVIDPKWVDTAEDVSGDALWYAVLKPSPSNREYAQIVGFIQTKYLKLRN